MALRKIQSEMVSNLADLGFNTATLYSNLSVYGEIRADKLTYLSAQNLEVNSLSARGNIFASGNLLVLGSLSALGDTTYIDTTIVTTSAMSITNVGTGPALIVNQTGSQPVANFLDDGNIALSITDGANVGIRTANPRAVLHVSGNVAAESLSALNGLSAFNLNITRGPTFRTPLIDGLVQLSNESQGNTRIVLDNYDQIGTTRPEIYTRHARGTSLSPTATQSNDAMFILSNRGYDPVAGFGSIVSSLRFYAAETFTDTNRGTYVTLNTTAKGVNNDSERLRIHELGITATHGISARTVFLGPHSTALQTITRATGVEGGQPPAPLTDTLLHAVNTGTGLSTVLDIDNYSTNGENTIAGRRSKGTITSPTAVVADDIILQTVGYGYVGGITSPTFSQAVASVQLRAAETFTDTANGTYIQFNAVDNTTTTLKERLRVVGNGQSVGQGISVTGGITITGNIIAAAGNTNLSILNTVATTINAFGAATNLTIGATTGTATIRNATVTLSNATALNIDGTSPSIATVSTGTVSVFNTNALTGNLFGAATNISIGSTTTAAQTISIGTGATVSAATKAINIGTGGLAGSTTNIALGSSTGTSTITINGTLTMSSATLNINGASPSIVTSDTGTASVFNTSALTGNLFGAATTISIGSTTTAAQTISIGTGVTVSGATKTINIGTNGASGSTTNINIGAGGTSGVVKISNLLVTGANASTIVSAATIAPAAQISFVSGTTQINTITVPSGMSNGGQITLIPTGLWTTGTTGNIALATTAVVSRALIMTYDAGTAKWYPSY